MILDDYSCDGQITLTDYLKSKIKSGEVKDLTNFINSQGKAQYTQIGEVIHNSYERYKYDEDMIKTMNELEKHDIQTDFLYEKDGEKGYWLEIL